MKRKRIPSLMSPSVNRVDVGKEIAPMGANNNNVDAGGADGDAGRESTTGSVLSAAMNALVTV